ncbi:Ldh family oxidoreductase [Streptomonospora wellingtoniae]|uniref:Ldh family oxidoreductase n=1 Tax=Streptomonospora wellingtoniae TaxID=3075544 RepID=A0ABU2KQ53_9ACTN|nr:Ldh family oxidoreductase [Streptomonospora sp. DSM 45055]MDT0301420.1 Ldh family oxidoreductase [Streptomonospora sp. DSM 45055]
MVAPETQQPSAAVKGGAGAPAPPAPVPEPGAPPEPRGEGRRVFPADLLAFAERMFAAHGLPPERAGAAAEALCYGDLCGHPSHGLANLTRIYLPALADGRVDPRARPRTVADNGASLLVDACRAPGLWQAGAAMDTAVQRAREYGVGLVSVRGATHFGCAGRHAARAVEHGMIGVVAANCGRQRIAPPPGGLAPMLGTNPLSVAAPALPDRPFVLDMSTTAAPTGRVREAARAGSSVPAGWLADSAGVPVTDPAAFDRGDAHLLWLGAGASARSGGAYKGFGLALAVEVLAALLPGAGLGPVGADEVDDRRDDDIGFLAAAIAPDRLREGFGVGAGELFSAVLEGPPADSGAPVRYPGWHEAEAAARHRRDGVRLPSALLRELAEAADAAGVARVAAPPANGGR